MNTCSRVYWQFGRPNPVPIFYWVISIEFGCLCASTLWNLLAWTQEEGQSSRVSLTTYGFILAHLRSRSYFVVENFLVIPGIFLCPDPDLPPGLSVLEGPPRQPISPRNCSSSWLLHSLPIPHLPVTRSDLFYLLGVSEDHPCGSVPQRLPSSVQSLSAGAGESLLTAVPSSSLALLYPTLHTAARGSSQTAQKSAKCPTAPKPELQLLSPSFQALVSS